MFMSGTRTSLKLVPWDFVRLSVVAVVATFPALFVFWSPALFIGAARTRNGAKWK